MPSTLVSAFSDAQLIIFDKDGTLTHCNKCYGPWLENVASKLQVLGFISDASSFFHALDYDVETKSYGKTASVVHGTPNDVMDDCAREAFKQLTAMDIAFDVFRDGFLEKCANGPEGDIWRVEARFLTAETLEMCGTRLLELFGLLSEAGVKVAVCTSDERYVTAETMRVIQLDRFLNIVEKDGLIEDDLACGSDSDIARKPMPDGILKLIRLHGVSPDRTVMVGDSFGDMIAGLRAGCKKLVFVETGGHTAEELISFIRGPEFGEISQASGIGEVDVAVEISHADEMVTGRPKIFALRSIDEMLN